MNFREQEEKIAWHQSSNERKKMVSFKCLLRRGWEKIRTTFSTRGIQFAYS